MGDSGSSLRLGGRAVVIDAKRDDRASDVSAKLTRKCWEYQQTSGRIRRAILVEFPEEMLRVIVQEAIWLKVQPEPRNSL
jgi:hypothetical protein